MFSINEVKYVAAGRVYIDRYSFKRVVNIHVAAHCTLSVSVYISAIM